jgi:hypothetical protein
LFVKKPGARKPEKKRSKRLEKLRSANTHALYPADQGRIGVV